MYRPVVGSGALAICVESQTFEPHRTSNLDALESE